MISFIIDILSKINLPRKKVDGKKLSLITNNLRPGDLILTKRKWALTNLFIPGTYKHGMMYVGVNNVVEAIDKGVALTNVYDALLNKDMILILRQNISSEAQYSLAAENIYLGFLNKKYDKEFIHDNDKYYCFELLVKLLQKSFPAIVFNAYKRFGREIYTEKTFTDSKLFHEVVKVEKLRKW